MGAKPEHEAGEYGAADLGARPAAQGVVTLAQSRTPACISFTTSNAMGRLSIVAACCGIGVLLFEAVE